MHEMVITLRGMITWIWNFTCTPIYSLVCMVALLFSRQAGYAVGVTWCRHMLQLSGVTCRVKGLNKIKPYHQYILVCNHSSHLDIPVLMVHLPLMLIFIAKKELFQIPFFGWGIRALGHVAIDRSSPRRARDCIEHTSQQLKKHGNQALVIFPEGTRTSDGSIRPFKQGSFALAQSSNLPVVPVAIKGTYQALPKKRLLARPAQVDLIIGEGLNPEQYDKNTMAQTTYWQISGLLAD